VRARYASPSAGSISITRRCSKERIQTSPERCTRRDKGAEPFSTGVAALGPRILPPRLFVFRPNRSSLSLFLSFSSAARLLFARLFRIPAKSQSRTRTFRLSGGSRDCRRRSCFSLSVSSARAAGHDVRAARYHRRDACAVDVPICLISARAVKSHATRILKFMECILA
jgi:hypothetical protein